MPARGNCWAALFDVWEALVATLTWSVPVVQAVAGRGCLSVFVVGPELVGGAEEALAEAGEEA